MSASILIVDDEPDFCAALRDILEAEGHQVTIEPSASRALTRLETATPDLILTDLMMPGLDGIGFLRRLRERPTWSAVPAVVISARGMAEDLAEARAAGADDYLVKPFSADELRAMVASHVPRASTLAGPPSPRRSGRA